MINIKAIRKALESKPLYSFGRPNQEDGHNYRCAIMELLFVKGIEKPSSTIVWKVDAADLEGEQKEEARILKEEYGLNSITAGAIAYASDNAPEGSSALEAVRAAEVLASSEVSS